MSNNATQSPERVTSVKLHGEWYDLVDGIHLCEVDTRDYGRQPGFSATFTDGRPLRAAFQDVEEFGPIRPRNFEETKAIEDNIAKDAAEQFQRQHRTTEATFDKLVAKQKGRCFACNELLQDMTHVNDGHLVHAYRPCSDIAYTY